MSNGKLVYSQLLDFLDRNHFNYLVRKYDGDKYVKNFTCYNQLAVLMYGQLSNRESLRDVVFAAQALEDKAYRLGFGKNVSKSTLADANNKRDYHIFEQFAYHTNDYRTLPGDIQMGHLPEESAKRRHQSTYPV